MGAGLGSSAAYSACIATALLLLHRRVELPPFPERSRLPKNDDPGHLHVSHEGRRAIPADIAEEINRWAFVSEKVLHGNPSGVDNSIVVFGGALAYTKPGFGKRSGMDKIHGYVSLRKLVITLLTIHYVQIQVAQVPSDGFEDQPRHQASSRRCCTEEGRGLWLRK